MNPLVQLGVKHAKAVVGAVALTSVLLLLLAAVPTLQPGLLPFLTPLTVDTDPENMLSADEPVRLFHDHMKTTLGLWDMVVVGVVNSTDPNGVYNPASLAKVHALTEFAMTLTGDVIGAEPGQGVVSVDVISPSTVDVIEPGQPGEISFAWLMRPVPTDPAAATAVLEQARRIPFLNGTLVPPPEAGNAAIALYLPITRKDLSHAVYTQLNRKAAELGGPEQYYITGLPVAEDTFGVEMFKQMAISAPIAMLVIFLLMLLFFRKLALIISPMLVAVVSVIFTMTSLIIAGFPIHIMSSMIPIFIMPIAVLDSIHILSEVFEKFKATGDRRRTIATVMDELFMPMLYTSLTSAAGFASLALTPIPPVQVFGVFVAMGIMVAWLLTIVFIPAYIMLLPERAMADFGATQPGRTDAGSWLSRSLHSLALFTYARSKLIMAAAGVLLVISGWGITRIVINDNPIKWFTPSHPIRVADKVMNQHLAGTYMAYLALHAADAPYDATTAAAEFLHDLQADPTQVGQLPAPVLAQLEQLATAAAAPATSHSQFYSRLSRAIADQHDDGGGRAGAQPAPASSTDGGPSLPGGLGTGGPPALPGGLGATAGTPDRLANAAWQRLADHVGNRQQQLEVFKDPAVLHYISKLQQVLQEVGNTDNRPLVGKSNSLADIVKTVHRDLFSGTVADFRIPDNRNAVAETLLQFQNSHRPGDLWHFVTPDFRTTSIWVQLRSGDNRDMSAVARAVDRFMAAEPPPQQLQAMPQWFGLTYINVVWQDKMVRGMLQAFAGSFLVVFLLMSILFRSALWGALSMIPLTVTIAVIYGVVGIIGKDYDMPTAVLSSLTLGLAVDFAIHFLARSRELYSQEGSWRLTVPRVFAEPARAISRNIIVIAAGFLPLLLAPLMPYKTVGVLLATILLISGISTLFILPALIRWLEKPLFNYQSPVSRCRNCATCIITAIAAVLLIMLNARPFLELHWTVLAAVAAAAVVVIAGICGMLSRRQACRRHTEPPAPGGEPAANPESRQKHQV